MSAPFKAALLAFCTIAISGAADAQTRQFKVASAVVGVDQRTGAPVVSFLLTQESARDFGRLTQDNVGRKVSVRVDRRTLTEVVIREPILGGTGQFTVPTAEDGKALAARLSDGSAVLEIRFVPD